MKWYLVKVYQWYGKGKYKIDQFITQTPEKYKGDDIEIEKIKVK